jgi:ABC-type glycerol-3-phosphate transport system substrate-binding protein
MKQATSVVILAVFLCIGAGLVYLRARREEPAGAGTTAATSVLATTAAPAPPPAARVTLPLLFSSEKEEWLRAAVLEFEKAHPEVDVQLEAKGSLEAIRLLLGGEAKPVLWSPADSLAVNLFESEYKLAKGTDPIVRDGSHWPRSLLLTPLVFVAWESRAKALVGTNAELPWARLATAVSSKKGWAGSGGNAGWGYVKFGHTDPSKSNSGLQALVLIAYGFYDHIDGLTVPDVTAPRFQDFLKAIETGRRGQDFAASSTEPFVENFIRQGPSLYDVVAVYESTAIAAIPRAAGRWEALRVFYPSVDLWSDHPICLLDGLNGTPATPEQKQAAALLVDFLMTAPVQQRALGYGFRPGNLDVPIVTQDSNNPFNRYRDAGIRIEVPRIAASPDGAVLQSLLQSYARNAP